MRRIGCIATILMTLALSMAVILLPKLEVHAEEVDVDAIKASIQEKQEQIEEAEKAKSKIKSNITNIQAMVSALEKEKGDLEAYVTKLDEDLTDVQEKIAERVGKSRAAVTNYMRLLKLPAQVQMALKNKDIDMGHARALLSLDSPSNQIKLFKEIQKNGYSVRKVEELVQMLKNGESVPTGRKPISSSAKLPKEFDILKERLSQFFDAKVSMTCSPKGKGKISIPFANEEELERIMNALDRANDH